MATLVLSTVGTILGGPVGGLIGSLVGQGIDQRLFGPGPRHGPRLGDLSVQTSSYGTPVPRIYGRMRVAGSVIWATELQEDSATRPGGKGQPDVVTYSYSVSLAVALSSRRARAIRRIWADGKLLRGSNGDFKVKCEFRFQPGAEDQAVDPLIASLEGIANTPAYRGLAIAVFENLELAEFGNRIPFLTFEIEADEAAVQLGTLLADATAGRVASSDARAVSGYAAHGATMRAAVEPLIEHFGVPLFDDGQQLRTPALVAPVTIPARALGSRAGDEGASRLERSQQPARAVPVALAIGYYDPSRDYQSGQARASIGRADGPNAHADVPVVLSSDEAKGLAESSLARRWSRRDKLVVRILPHYLALEPGSAMSVEGVSGIWRIEEVTIDRLAVQLDLRPWTAEAGTLPSDPGRPVPPPDIPPAPTRLALFDLPDLGVRRSSTPVLHLAAANETPGWRSLPIETSVGGIVAPDRTATSETVLGFAEDVLAGGQAMLFDLAGAVTVQLVDEAHWLESRDEESLIGGANLAALGDELIQFGTAEPLGGGRFRLSKLLRGRRGTEWAMDGHAAGEPFALLSEATLRAIAVPRELTGAEVKVTPVGIGDVTPAAVARAAMGEALRPPSPVRLTAVLTDGGTLQLAWIRRSRDGFAWLDGSDVPLGESAERYRVVLDGSAATVEAEAATNAASFGAAQVLAAGPGPASVSVVQIGDLALSRPARLTITL